MNRPEEKETAFGIVGKFWRSYKAKSAETSDVDWLDGEFADIPKLGNPSM